MAKASRPLIVENIALSRWLHRKGACASGDGDASSAAPPMSASADLYNDRSAKSFRKRLNDVLARSCEEALFKGFAGANRESTAHCKRLFTLARIDD
ncbi:MULTISPECIES: hypothetical protein [unclassified Caballeronia]|uniref:hypothetical protein n=1 Tax=unclassified Caballeronia TaxID=2646786 RepID=UPI00202933C9|nr:MULTISPECIES: hypothetical protein [unclassified Caballeronia]MDR5767810.1 hypothetical protein [Caballeronia sp. LZ028]